MRRQSSVANDPLRRLDWRFLLHGAPGRPLRHLVLLGGTDDLPDIVRRYDIAEQVSQVIPNDRCVDAVVILQNSSVFLPKAADCLVTGGSLYCEVDRRSLASIWSSPQQLQRSLQHTQLQMTGLYWIRPNLKHRQVYVPLHAPGPLNWYLDTLLTASSPPARLLASMLRTLERTGNQSFSALAPCYALTAVAGPSSERSPAIIRHAVIPAEIRRSASEILVITQGTEDLKRVTVLPFATSSRQPLAVLKIGRLAEHAERTLREQDVLSKIHAALDDSMRESIPKALGTFHCDTYSVGIESVAAGHSIASKIYRWGAPLQAKVDELHQATSWLIEFHRKVQIRRSTWCDDDLKAWIDNPLTEYKDAFGSTRIVDRLFERTRREARDLVGVSLPTVWVHSDFSEYNIHNSEYGIIVLDWERGVPGPPLLDLIFFVTVWCFAVRGLRTDRAKLAAFRHLYCKPKRSDRITSAIHEQLRRYMVSVGVERRFLPIMLVVTCVTRALIHSSRRNYLGVQQSIAQPRNRYLDWIRALAEDADLLFPA